jgi:hypothetical protein
MTERSWVQTPNMETIFQAPFIWIKAWKKLWKTLTWHCCMCCNPANVRVDFGEWSAYKIQLHGIEWIVNLSAEWDQNPTTTKKPFLRLSLPWVMFLLHKNFNLVNMTLIVIQPKPIFVHTCDPPSFETLINFLSSHGDYLNLEWLFLPE